MVILGVDCLIEHVKRWCVSCGVGRVRRAGTRLQLIVGRARNSRVLLQRVRFVSRFGNLRHQNNARMARTKAEDSAPNSYHLPAKIKEQTLGKQRKTEPKSAKNR